MKTKLFLVLLSATITVRAQQAPDSLSKQQELTIDAQLFTRGELRNGGFSSVDEDEPGHAGFVLSRTRLSIDYRKPGLQAHVTAQHSGVWGQAGKGAFNLYEAWAQLSLPVGLFAKVGRQELAYDDERIMGRNDWAVAALSHDVLKFGYEGHGHKLHGILAFNQNAENTNGGTFYQNGAYPHKTMHAAWYHYDFPRFPLGVSLLWMNIGMQGGDDESNAKTQYQNIVGSFLKLHPRWWNVELSYYKQGGHDEYGVKINAWMASAKVQYTPTRHYGFTAGFDYLSGDKEFPVPGKGTLGLIRHEQVKGFNPIYGSHHQFYGAMDFFYVSTYVNGFTPGLQNFYVGGHCQPLQGLSLKSTYHFLSMATHLKEMDMTLGHELEFSASYALSKDASISAGYSYMWGTETMVRLKRSSENRNLRWAWLTLTISPRLFTTRW